MTYKLKACTFIASFLIALTALATEPLVFDSPEQEERFSNLTEELRCTVCQNQNLADSDAPLAQDLRREIQQMILAGRRINDNMSLYVASQVVKLMLKKSIHPPGQIASFL